MTRSIRDVVFRCDSVLVLATLLNWLGVWWLAAWFCGDGRISWPCSLGDYPFWLLAPSRLAVAAMCLWTRRWWTESVALLIALQMVIAGFVTTLAPDDIRVEAAVSLHIIAAPASQTIFAAVLLVIAVHRIVSRLPAGAVRSCAVLTAGILGALLAVGYVSNVTSQPAAERDVARLLVEEVLDGRRFSTAWPWSFERFKEIGAAVRMTEAHSPERPNASVGPTHFIAPFVLDVAYAYENGNSDNFRRDALVVGFFGWTTLVNRDSNPWAVRMKWYMFPY